ncbi:MAG: hypothetical protein MI861_03075 [Pirellulales bacterium]|nr:hypothetical protein [Pirellulales bacterium]
MRQAGLGINQYILTHRRFPPGRIGCDDSDHHLWSSRC